MSVYFSAGENCQYKHLQQCQFTFLLVKTANINKSYVLHTGALPSSNQLNLFPSKFQPIESVLHYTHYP